MNKGFTLIEVMVSVAIITLVSIGVIFGITLNLNTASRIKNSLIAANLAQEGLEIVRNIRDNDWHSGGPSNFGSSLSAGTYLVEWNSLNLMPFSDTFLKKDANGFYNYTSGENTIFKRKIIIEDSTQNPSSVEKIAKVEVSWQEKGMSKKIQAELHLFNWK